METKKLFIFLPALITIFFLSQAVIAQPPADIDKRLEHLKDRLTLNDDQTTQIRDILERADAERDRLRELNEENREKMRSAMRDLRDETDQQIDSILTADQKTEYEKMKKELRENRGRRGPRDGYRHHERQ